MGGGASENAGGNGAGGVGRPSLRRMGRAAREAVPQIHTA